MAASASFPDLEGASVIVTGGGSGIGAALVEGFAAQGSRVAFIDIAEQASRELAARVGEATGNEPVFYAADLRDVAALREAVQRAEARHGPITILVNNAGWDDRHSVEAVTPDYWDNNQAINLRSQFFAIQAVVPGMKASGRGAIVNFTSTAYMINGGNLSSYTAAKGGIVGMTKGMAGELGPFGIRVNAIAPGWVLTDRQRELWVTDEALRRHVERQCLKLEIAPADMVGPCLFLASDASRVVTAQTLVVDAGSV